MKTPLSTPVVGLSGFRRLRGLLSPIVQSAVAAGLAWYLARLLGHVQPFFAPIAAAVCLWVSDMVRAQLAVEMMIGVALGIAVGTGTQAVLGNGPTAIAAAVLLALCAAVLIGRSFLPQRPMFVNQTATSAILVLAFPHGGLGAERLFDALIGGGLAVIFSILLFPKNPVTVLRNARRSVVAALGDALKRIASLVEGTAPSNPDRMLPAVDRLEGHLLRLTEARSVSTQLARVAPLRWPLRRTVRTADEQAAQLTLLVRSVLHLERTVSTFSDLGEQLSPPLRAAINDLAVAGAALVANNPGLAAVHTASVRRQSAHPPWRAPITAQALINAVIDNCVDEFQQVIDLSSR